MPLCLAPFSCFFLLQAEREQKRITFLFIDPPGCGWEVGTHALLPQRPLLLPSGTQVSTCAGSAVLQPCDGCWRPSSDPCSALPGAKGKIAPMSNVPTRCGSRERSVRFTWLQLCLLCPFYTQSVEKGLFGNHCPGCCRPEAQSTGHCTYRPSQAPGPQGQAPSA